MSVVCLPYLLLVSEVKTCFLCFLFFYLHQMMPNLGQGGCQAIEDAYVLCNLLCEVSSKDEIPNALQEYYR